LLDVQGIEFEQIFFNPVVKLGGELADIHRHAVDGVLAGTANIAQSLLAFHLRTDDKVRQQLPLLVLQGHAAAHTLGASGELFRIGVDDAKLFMQGGAVAGQ
jgi:hypothetical protein